MMDEASMRVWLDDERPMPGDFDVHAHTAHEAIELIKAGSVEYISLDHDLGSGCDTGQAVADFIEREAFEGRLGRLRVMLHTQNPVGRGKMAIAIQNAQRYWSEREQRRVAVTKPNPEEPK